MKLLEKLYPDHLGSEIALRVNHPLTGVYGKAKKLGLKKSEVFNAGPLACRLDGKLGAGTRFQKGNPSWLKGRKGWRAGGRSAETRFPKEHRPHNHLPVGSVVMATIGYLKIKIGEPKIWRFLHRKNWEEKHGRIPRGKAVSFKDGNRLNCAVENLELVNRRQLMSRNTIHKYPTKVKQLIRLNAKLKRTIGKACEKQD